MDRTQQTVPVLKVAGDARLDVRAFAGQRSVLAFLENGGGRPWRVAR